MANNVLQKVLVSVMLLVMMGASVLTSSAFVVNKQQSMNRVVSHVEQITAIGAWWNNDWYYRKPLTIDHTKVVDDLENFSILVHYQSSDIAMHAQSDEDNFVFTTADGIKLNHEIETYNASSGELVAWVNIAHLSSTVDTSLYMYYGDAGCSNQENIKETRDSYYVGIWRMSDASGDIRDSNGTQNGIQSGLPLYKQQGIGTMGNSIFLNGSDNTYFNITNLTYKSNTENITLEMWAKLPENWGYYDHVVYFGDADFLPSVDMAKYPNTGVNNGKLFGLNYIDGGPHNIAWADTSHINQWIFFLFNVSFDITDIIG